MCAAVQGMYADESRKHGQILAAPPEIHRPARHNPHHRIAALVAKRPRRLVLHLHLRERILHRRLDHFARARESAEVPRLERVLVGSEGVAD